MAFTLLQKFGWIASAFQTKHLLLFDIGLSNNNQVKNTQSAEGFFSMKTKSGPSSDISLVIASHNAGKIDEFADLLAPFSIQIESALGLGLEDVEETGKSFEENALLKAVQTAQASGHLALGDDSGVCVTMLDGAPGMYTARWAETKNGARDWDLAMGRVADKLRAIGTDDWSAKFVCVLALAWPDGRQILTRGEVEGQLIWPVRGTRGFGYDPMFVPNGEALSFGEMDPVRKHGMSHRHVAFQKLLAHGVFDERD